MAAKTASDSAAVTVAVDVMGADNGPGPVIEGLFDAVESLSGVRCVVVGTSGALAAHIPQQLPPTVSTEVAEEVVGMGDDPLIAVRAKRGSSLLRGLQLVRNGGADAFVTAGNTGAVVVAAAAVLHRLPGVLHPALATPMTSATGAAAVLVDCGATTKREAAWLQQYATFGVALAEAVLGVRAHIGLLANGIEAIKGDAVIREAHEHLAATQPGYVGLVEPEVLYGQDSFVVVTDGLLGNVLLKTVEATFRSMVPVIDQLVLAAYAAGVEDPRALVPASRGDTLGRGAILLGVDGVVVKAHGSGTARGTKGAITLAATACRSDLVARVRRLVTPRTATGR